LLYEIALVLEIVLALSNELKQGRHLINLNSKLETLATENLHQTGYAMMVGVYLLRE